MQEKAGQPVTLLARPRQLESLAHLPMRSLAQLEAGSRFEDVIFTVKAFQVEEAGAGLAASGVEFQRVWGFQNGLGSDEKLAAHFPGKSLSGKIALVGQTGSHAPQSMHSSG